MKLLLPRNAERDVPEDLESLDLNDYVKRSYTIVRVQQQTLTLDFVVHAIGGPAARWVTEAASGQEVVVTGPGPVQMLDPEATSFLLAGDMTGLPGIRVNLEKLPRDAVGVCFLEVTSKEDVQEMPAPQGVRLHWLFAGEGEKSRLSAAVREESIDAQGVGIWAASEYSTMKELRAHFLKLGVNAARSYVSSYWKRDATDEEHKAAKRREEAQGLLD